MAQVARSNLPCSSAEFAVHAPCEVLFGGGLHVGLEVFAEQLGELGGVLRLFVSGLFPVQADLGVALAVRDASHAQVHSDLGALAVEIGLQLIEDVLLVLGGDVGVVLDGLGVEPIFMLGGERLLTFELLERACRAWHTGHSAGGSAPS